MERRRKRKTFSPSFKAKAASAGGSAGRVGLSQTTVSRFWRAFNLQPHPASLGVDLLTIDRSAVCRQGARRGGFVYEPARPGRWRRPEDHVYFTPTLSSWLNQVEWFYAEIITSRVWRGVFRGAPKLEATIRLYLDGRYPNAKPHTPSPSPGPPTPITSSGAPPPPFVNEFTSREV